MRLLWLDTSFLRHRRLSSPPGSRNKRLVVAGVTSSPFHHSHRLFLVCHQTSFFTPHPRRVPPRILVSRGSVLPVKRIRHGCDVRRPCVPLRPVSSCPRLPPLLPTTTRVLTSRLFFLPPSGPCPAAEISTFPFPPPGWPTSPSGPSRSTLSCPPSSAATSPSSATPTPLPALSPRRRPYTCAIVPRRTACSVWPSTPSWIASALCWRSWRSSTSTPPPSPTSRVTAHPADAGPGSRPCRTASAPFVVNIPSWPSRPPTRANLLRRRDAHRDKHEAAPSRCYAQRAREAAVFSSACACPHTQSAQYGHDRRD